MVFDFYKVMSNVIGGTFEDDLQAKAWESGNSSQPQTQQNQQNNNPFLQSNPYLNPNALDLNAARGEKPSQFQKVEFTRVETITNQKNFSQGSMTLNIETMSVEHRISQLMEKLSFTEIKNDSVLEKNEPEKVTDERYENKIKKTGQSLALISLTQISKVSKGLFGLFKEVFGAFYSLIKENVTFKVYTKEQKQKMEEEKVNNQKKAAEQRTFFGKIQENSKDLLISNMKNLNELEDRLGIAGLSTEMRNKYLGRRRNLSHSEKNVHLAHFTALGVLEEREEKLAQNKRVKFASEQKPKDPLDLNKVAEGGSVLSSTGGQGAG